MERGAGAERLRGLDEIRRRHRFFDSGLRRPHFSPARNGGKSRQGGTLIRPPPQVPRGLRQGPRASPAKRVAWGEEEQGSGCSFRRKAETETSGLCDDEGTPRGNDVSLCDGFYPIPSGAPRQLPFPRGALFYAHRIPVTGGPPGAAAPTGRKRTRAIYKPCHSEPVEHRRGNLCLVVEIAAAPAGPRNDISIRGAAH